MPNHQRRQRKYFSTPPEMPRPLCVLVQRRIQFSDVDPMAVLWHGRYAQLFEQANEELGRLFGLTYEAFYHARLRAPIVQLHTDYFSSIYLNECVTVLGRMIWSDAARLNIEYEVHKEDDTVAATGFTVQMFVNEDGEPLLTPPPLLQECQRRWQAGEFHQESHA